MGKMPIPPTFLLFYFFTLLLLLLPVLVAVVLQYSQKDYSSLAARLLQYCGEITPVLLL